MLFVFKRDNDDDDNDNDDEVCTQQPDDIAQSACVRVLI